MSNMERIKVGKSEATKMLKLLEMFYRKVGSESYLDAKNIPDLSKVLGAMLREFTKSNDAFSKWRLSAPGIAWLAWKLDEDGVAPNGGPAEAGVVQPTQYHRQEASSLGHRIVAAKAEEAKCKHLYEWLEEQLDSSWDSQKKDIADNNSTLSIYQQLQQLVRYISNLGLGKASLVSAELNSWLQALPTADSPSEVVARVEKMEEICVLLARHRELVTATVDDIATAAAVAQMQPVEVAVDVIVPVPVVYKSCPDLPTDDMLYNLLASLVVETTANLIICAELYRLEKARASWSLVKSTMKEIAAANGHKKHKVGQQSHALVAESGQSQVRYEIACAALQQQQQQQQQQEMEQQFQQQQFHQLPGLPMHQQQMMAFSAYPRPPVYGKSPGACYAYQRGECHRGESCRFSHDTAAPAGRETSSATATATAAPTATQSCSHYQQGRCIHGNNCRFRHDLPGTLGVNFRGAGAGGM